MTTHAQEAIEEAGFPDLAAAAAAGDVSAVVEQLDAGCQVDERFSDGMTALMLAAAFGHREVLCTLLARGATVDLAREDGATALAVAAFFGRHPIVRELVVRGANVAVIGRHRAALETWAEKHGLIDDTDPSLEAVILEEHQQSEIAPHQEQDPVPSFDAPVLAAQARPPVLSNSVYGFDWYADERAVSPASVWAPDYEQVSFSPIGNQVPAALLVSTKPSGSDFASVDIADEYAFLGLGAESDFRSPDDWEMLTGLAMDPIGDPIGDPIEETIEDPISDPIMDDDDEVTAQLPSIDEPEDPLEEAWITDEFESVDEPEVISMPVVDRPETVFRETYPVLEPEFVRAEKRARVLDESSVLPGEASFATVPLFQGATRSYSPVIEFVTKLRRIGIPVFLTILACVGAAWLEIRYATARSILNSLNTAEIKQTSAPQRPSTVIPVSTKRASTAPLAGATVLSPKSSPVGTNASVTPPLSPKPVSTGRTPSAVDVRAYSAITSSAAPQPKKAKVTTPKPALAKARGSESLHQRTTGAHVQPKPALTTITTPKSDVKPPVSPYAGSVRPRRVGTKDQPPPRPNP